MRWKEQELSSSTRTVADRVYAFESRQSRGGKNRQRRSLRNEPNLHQNSNSGVVSYSKSGGPRSKAGKRRASRNSFRHGPSRPAALSSSDEVWIELFARAATKRHRTIVTLEPARSAARAHLDLVCVSQLRAEILDRLQVQFERAVSKGLKFDFLRAIHEHLPRHERNILKLLREPGDQLRRLNRYEQTTCGLATE
jgi:hypothetical protein